MAQVRLRLVEERANQTASSLTFTTILALVPLVTVALAIFTAFPAFEKLRVALEDYFIESLMPAQVASIVTTYLMQFANKAKSLSVFGIVFLIVTVIAMFLTIEKSLNAIWQVPVRAHYLKQNRRWFISRLLVYWAILSMAPFALGASFYAMTQLVISTKGLGAGLNTMSKLAMQLLPLVLALGIWAFIFKTIPNTPVKWRHAFIGALISSILLELLKRAFVIYLGKYANFKELYGAFSVLPVMLIWLYLGWWVTLLGAAIAALLPKWGVRFIHGKHAFEPVLHQLKVLNCLRLAQAQSGAAGAMSVEAIAMQTNLPVDLARRQLVLLQYLDWVAKIDTDRTNVGDSWVLLVNLSSVSLKSLLNEHVWMCPRHAVSSELGQKWAQLESVTLEQALVVVESR